jgi:hypothetical protein
MVAVGLPAAVEEVLAVYPDAAAGRATAALHLLLDERLASADLAAWTSSHLTGDGFPVEFAFTTADDRLRYTVEPGSAADTPQERLEKALALVNRLSGATVPQGMVAAWRQAQRGADLRYGAWVAGRHGLTGDEYKLYVEMPGVEGDVPLAADGPALYPRPQLGDRTASARMVAFSPQSGQHEIYYRVPSMLPGHVLRVLTAAGLEAHKEELLSTLGEAYGYPWDERLPGESVGFSYSLDRQAQPQAVTLFFFGRVFWGGDARIREKFGCWSTALGWDDSRYQYITLPLADQHAWTTRHGILGFTLARDGRQHLSIGVRPPDP